MRRFRWAVAISILSAGLTTGVYLARPRTGQSAGAIRTVRAERRKIGTVVNATATVRLRVGSEVRVGTQISGIVKKLNVTVGSPVRAGEVIAEVDDAPLQARLADSDAQVNLDRATLERARVNSDRAQTLAAEGVIPPQQAQDLKLALEEADARYKKSIGDRDLIKVDLNYVHIHAPISGIVASVSTQEGETVAASFAAPTFVTIIGSHALQLVAVVDETDIANVRRGNQVIFTVDSYPSHEFGGEVESVAPKATIISGVVNYEVTIEIARDASLLKPDMTANVSIKTAEHEALVLPGEAVERAADQTFVLVAVSGAAEKRLVVTGNKEGGLIEIKKGITLADDVQLPPVRQRVQGF